MAPDYWGPENILTNVSIRGGDVLYGKPLPGGRWDSVTPPTLDAIAPVLDEFFG